MASLSPSPQSDIHPEPTGQLTPQERKTAALLARGLSNREIAAQLVIAEGTAKLHVKHILQKLGFTCRAQITAWSLQHGLVETSSLAAAS
jgi:non-specific serine/threonine protein kinase